MIAQHTLESDGPSRHRPVDAPVDEPAPPGRALAVAESRAMCIASSMAQTTCRSGEPHNDRVVAGEAQLAGGPLPLGLSGGAQHDRAGQ